MENCLSCVRLIYVYIGVVRRRERPPPKLNRSLGKIRKNMQKGEKLRELSRDNFDVELEQ